MRTGRLDEGVLPPVDNYNSWEGVAKAEGYS
jgi:hypothetical protein